MWWYNEGVHIADAFFAGTLAFLLGVLLSSAGLTSGILVIFAVFEAVCITVWVLYSYLPPFFRNVSRASFVLLASLFLLLPVGSIYYHLDDVGFRSANVPLGREVRFSGVVVNDPVIAAGGRQAVLELSAPLSGRILLKLPAYPAISYGDALRGQGSVLAPEPEWYARYLAKERVVGIVKYANVERTAVGAGSPVKSFLFSVKHSVTDSFKRTLPSEQASFLSGLTVGERAEFSKEFTEAMQRSGTTHLVALSGYNISIVVATTMAFFLYFLRRRLAFVCTFAVVIGFVCMTGAEASVVRAALMGVLALVAREAGRQFDVRNAIMAAGLVMVIANPKVLLFDVGFQLSFLALLGIVYLEPVCKRFLRFADDGFLNWKANLTTTLAAQLAVAPLLIAQFGGVSLTSLIANVLVLSAVPVTMGLGFIVAAASFVSVMLAQALGLVALVLLKFEMLVIMLFSALAIPVAPMVGWGVAAVYYAALVFAGAYNARKTQKTPLKA